LKWIDDITLPLKKWEALEDEVENPQASSEEIVEDSSTIGLYFRNLLEFDPKTGPADS
jgi:hypothetical protein